MSPKPVGDRVERLAQAIAERVVNLVLDAIDLNAIIDRIDINAVVAKVDLDAIIDQIDMDKVIDRIDINAVVKKVDIDGIVSHMDIDSLVEQTELGSIIAKSTSGVLTEVLDLVRSQGVGLDDFFARWTNRILRRKPGTVPIGPPLLITPPVPPALPVGRPSLDKH